MTFLAFFEGSIQLVPDGSLLVHIGLILLMVYVLNATLFRPINKILEERERRTSGRSGEAQETLKQVDKTLSHYEQSLREARAEGYRLLEQQRADAMRERQSQLNTVREELENSIDDQKELIRKQFVEARETLKGEAQRRAAEISAQILNRYSGDSSLSPTYR